MKRRSNERADEGFTLVELLITIVVVGILTAVAVVGIGGVIDNGSTAACQATMDAAKAATAGHKANTGGYPQTFADLTSAAPRLLEVPAGLTQAALTLKKGTNWTLTMMPNGPSNITTYACS